MTRRNPLPQRSLAAATVALAATMYACSPSVPADTRPAAPKEQSDEITRLRAEVAQLKTENSELRATPTAMLAVVEAAVRAGDVELAAAAFQQLSIKYPSAPETKVGISALEALATKIRATQREQARLASLGFKALKVSPVFAGESASVKLGAVTIGGQWRFDSYDSEWRYQEAERGNRFVTASIVATSKAKDPNLLGVGVYKIEGATLVHLGNLEYRFARWNDFGSYLGNEADFNNDFAHRPNVSFSLGVQIEEAKLKGAQIYLIATAEGCHTRIAARLHSPPISYVGGSCASLKPSLTIEDFKAGTLGVLKVLG